MRCFAFAAMTCPLLALLLLCCVVEAGPWQDCGERFKQALEYNVNGNVSRYLYTQRPTHLLPGKPPPLMVTFAGCRRFCGRGRQRTDWDRVCDALMTWLLPLATLVLQAPFESNQFRATLLMLARWLGNPCVAIGGSLWSIRVTSRCAALLDRSLGDGPMPPHYFTDPAAASQAGARSCRDTLARVARWFIDDDGVRAAQPAPRHGADAFSHLRDSLYIITVLNQYELNYDSYVSDVHAFLRFALFSYEAGAGNGGSDDGNGGGDGGDGSGRSSRQGSVSPANAGVAEGGDLSLSALPAHASAMTAAAGAAGAASVEAPAPAPADDDGDEALATAVRRLRDKRAVLAEHLRATRKHGVVPALLSLLGFGLALAISLTQAYGRLGAQLSEYRLSLGLMMTWLPVLTACTLLDRNPASTDLTRIELQRFFDGALDAWRAQQQQQQQQRRRHALAQPVAPPTLVLAPNMALDEAEGIPLVALAPPQPSPSPLPPPGPSSSPVPSATHETQAYPPFVLAFAGQVRRKWHRGVAYDSIVEMEQKVADWRTRSNNGRLDYVHLFEAGHFARVDDDDDHDDDDDNGDTGRGAGRLRRRRRHYYARFFHVEQAWQLLAALLIVGPATAGAFIVSYNTPPVGIGCRAAGFMTFGILALGGCLLDMLGSWLHHQHDGARGRSPRPAAAAPPMLAPARAQAAAQIVRATLTLHELLTSLILVLHLLGQAFLWYQTCFCRASMWSVRLSRGSSSARGGYIDFEDDDYYLAHFSLLRYWRAGTVLGCAPLAAVLYAVAEWCLQSHLWSADFGKAMRGLRRVRRVRRARDYGLGLGGGGGGGAVWRSGYAALARCARSVAERLRRCRRPQPYRAPGRSTYGPLSRLPAV